MMASTARRSIDKPGYGGVYLGPGTALITHNPPAESFKRESIARTSSKRKKERAGSSGQIESVVHSVQPEYSQTKTQSLIRRFSRSKSPMSSGKTRCDVCEKKISGEALRAADKYFHLACFKCKTCQRPLSEVGYIEHEGHYLCPHDYHAHFGARCPACGQFVEGNVVQFMGQTFHQRCFKCTQCNQPFPQGEKVTFDGNEHVCKRCLKQTQPGNITNVKAIPATQIIGYQPQIRAISPPAEISSTVCAACNQQIHSGQVLLALDAQWHIWCFKCTTCDSVLHGEYMAKENKPYCIRDYNASFGVRCYECDKYIAGKVLQAGGYKFHPTCARCSRCDEHFGDGQEMYMQGDEIWHPRCNDIKPPEKIFHTSPKSARSGTYAPKYQVDFGKHLTYMYLLPETESTYLRHPIAPHPPPPAQFHTPQGPVKIRKSRVSLLKTGMQRLTENLEKNSPRPKSPHMDNEEPIEMSHYPAGHAPGPNEIPAIEREDFPAPPYPYAVEELKRRLSSSSIENDDDEEEEMEETDGDKLKKEVEELDKFQKDSSIAHVIMQNLEERQKKTKLPLHWDPRNASRTPSAKKMPHLKCRYETPINASPSRYLNRPKPWIFWQGGDKSATTTIPYFASPRPGYGLAPKAATLPGGYNYADMSLDNLNTTISSQFSDQLLHMPGGGTLPPHMVGTYDPSRYQASYGTNNIRTSLPDMSKPPKVYPLGELKTTNKQLPEDVDRCHLERHLNREAFEELFKMTPIEFYKLPDWKRVNMKRKVKLF